MAGIDNRKQVKSKKELRLEKAQFKEFKRGVKRGYKLTPDDLPQIEYRYFEHDIRSCPKKCPNGWLVSFWITYPNDPDGRLPGYFGAYDNMDAKPTIGDAHQVGFAIARAIISGHPQERLHDFTAAEQEEIQRFCGHLEIKRIALKAREERKANPIPISTKYLSCAELSEKQLRTLLRIAVSTFVVFEFELFSTFDSLRAFTVAATEQAGSNDENECAKDWMARLPPLVDSLESLMRMAHDYQGYGWPHGDPFVTRPMQILEDIRKRYPETTIGVTDDSAQSLDLIYPKQTLFTIFHELIANTIKHSGETPQARIAWHVRCDRFICEIEDDGPGISENLSANYLELWKLGGIRTGRGLSTVEHALIDSHSSLSFRRSAELGGTQVKIELPLVGYWLDDELHLWKKVYETTYIYPPIQGEAA